MTVFKNLDNVLISDYDIAVMNFLTEKNNRVTGYDKHLDITCLISH